MFYVYEWFVVDTNEIFYVGKGTGNRYKVRKHNKFFNDFINRYNCDSRIVKEFDKEADAFVCEYERIKGLKNIGQCVCNIYDGGFGGSVSVWTEEKRKKYSEKNVMKSASQRERMKNNNPMKNPNVSKKVRKKLCRAVVIGNMEHERAFDAAQHYGVTDVTIREWIKKGITPFGEKCFYKDGKPVNSQVIKNKVYDKTKHSKPVLIDGVLFESLKDAANYVGSTPSNLRGSIIRNGRYKGHICKYANQQPSRGKSDNSTAEGSTTNE